MTVAGPFALMFGASGRVFLVAVTILTNGFVYAALIALVLALREVFPSKNSRYEFALLASRLVTIAVNLPSSTSPLTGVPLTSIVALLFRARQDTAL
jgi:hypothetical protein